MIKIRHIAIMVKNLDKSVAFYRDLLGLSFVRTVEIRGTKAVDLTDGETNLRLLPATNPDAPRHDRDISVGFNHIGFIVEDIDETYRKLKESKVKFLSQAPADFFKISDPDGLVIDITCPTRGW
ncbi:MAG: VOC family protein [Deltaproteobacteria bacterium]|nr:VOC family protein [Deltaproteobacteria bacterium]